MKNPGFLSILLLLGLPGLAGAQEKKAAPYPAMAPIEQYRIVNAQDEIALARTAAPPAISSGAEVLVLGKHGYESAVAGRNGFVCFVERSWAAGFDDPEFWNPKLRAPNCFNPPAVRSVLPQYLKRTEWVLAGIGRAQMIEKARAAFANRDFTAPDAGSFSFMLSKQGYLSDDAAGPWLPHVMFFVPHGQAAAWGAGLDASPILGIDGGPVEPTVLFIPVPRWSDGSPAPLPATEHQHSRSVPSATSLPSVNEVMNRYVRAIGGRDAILKHQSMTIRGTLVLSARGLTLDRTVYYKDGKMRYELTLPGGQYKEGFDGKVAWSLHPRSGPAIARGDEVKSKQRDSDMYYPARILDYFASMEVVGVTEFEGHTCYHLKGTNKWQRVNEQFYDTDSGLLIGYRFNSAWRGGAGEESEVFSDYKDFGGWRMPTRAAHKSADSEQVEVITAVSFDDVADSVFELPAEVRELVGKTASEQRSG